VPFSSACPLHPSPIQMDKWVALMKLILILLVPILPVTPFALRTHPEIPVRMPTPEAPKSSRSSSLAPVDGSRRAPSPFTEREIRRRSEKWEVLRLEIPGWVLLMTDSFAIRSDGPPAELRAAGVYLEEAHRLHREMLGGDSSDLRFSVRVFRQEKDFRIYAQCRGVPEAASFYDPGGAEVVVPYSGNRNGLVCALMHEFCHQYLHRVFGVTRPIWLTEGLAEYFTFYSVGIGRLVPGADSPAHRERLRAARKDGTLIPLRRLIAMSREEFYSGNVLLAYAEAWALIRVLLSKRGDVHADPIGALLRGGSLGDLQSLDEEWSQSMIE